MACRNSHIGPKTEKCPLCGESYSPFISEAMMANFETLRRAVKNGDAALMECIDNKTGKPTALIVATAPSENGKEIDITPLAVLFTGDPYEDYRPAGGE